MTRRNGTLVIVFAALLVIGGCTENTEPTTGAESHFLESCTSDNDCGSALSCICGICTHSCDTVRGCADIGAATSCNSTEFEDSASCQGDDVLVCSSAEPCGDDNCTAGEDCSSCPADCGECGTFCDDGTCSMQDVELCPATGDCVCGDDVCEQGAESCESCELDCGACPNDFCNDGLCGPDDYFGCPDNGDCVCGDDVCTPWERDSCMCQADCALCP